MSEWPFDGASRPKHSAASRIIGTLLQAEIADKKARSIKYQMKSARLPTAKELADFDFAASPVNQPLIQELATGSFLEGQRNVVLVGGCATWHRVFPPRWTPCQALRYWHQRRG